MENLCTYLASRMFTYSAQWQKAFSGVDRNKSNSVRVQNPKQNGTNLEEPTMQNEYSNQPNSLLHDTCKPNPWIGLHSSTVILVMVVYGECGGGAGNASC